MCCLWLSQCGQLEEKFPLKAGHCLALLGVPSGPGPPLGKVKRGEERLRRLTQDTGPGQPGGPPFLGVSPEVGTGEKLLSWTLGLYPSPRGALPVPDH